MRSLELPRDAWFARLWLSTCTGHLRTGPSKEPATCDGPPRWSVTTAHVPALFSQPAPRLRAGAEPAPAPSNARHASKCPCIVFMLVSAARPWTGTRALVTASASTCEAARSCATSVCDMGHVVIAKPSCVHRHAGHGRATRPWARWAYACGSARQSCACACADRHAGRRTSRFVAVLACEPFRRRRRCAR